MQCSALPLSTIFFNPNFLRVPQEEVFLFGSILFEDLCYCTTTVCVCFVAPVEGSQEASQSYAFLQTYHI